MIILHSEIANGLEYSIVQGHGGSYAVRRGDYQLCKANSYSDARRKMDEHIAAHNKRVNQSCRSRELDRKDNLW